MKVLQYFCCSTVSLLLKYPPITRCVPTFSENEIDDNEPTLMIKNTLNDSKSFVISSDENTNSNINEKRMDFISYGTNNVGSYSCIKPFSWIKSTVFLPLLLMSSFMTPLNIVQNHHYHAVAEEGMACVTTNCSKELSRCLSNPTCAQGIGCFIGCATSDIVKNSGSSTITAHELGKTPKIEGTCQVRCMDLYQNQLLDDFTECCLTKNHCYQSLKEDERYPRLPLELSDIQLNRKRDVAAIKELFRGKWYVVAGLNPAFDTFDCQVHEFYEPKLPSSVKSDNRVADATFSYRVEKNRNEGFFTKRGDKRLTLVDEHQDTGQINNVLKELGEGKKWGIDSFHPTTAFKENDGMNLSESRKSLILTLRPNKMNYRDEWTILSYSSNPCSAFIVLAYRGANAAWQGYGGVNIYTREPMDISSLFHTNEIVEHTDKRIMRDGIIFGLQKIGLTPNDLTAVDNCCL